MNMHEYLERKRGWLTGAKRFFTPSGLSSEHILAAYQFKGMSSEAAALLDLSGRNFDLTKGSQTYNGQSHTPSWSSASGFTFDAVMYGRSGYLDNSSLNGQAIRCVVVRYTDLTQDNRGWLVTAGGDNGRCQITCATTVSIGGNVSNYPGPGYVWYSGHWRSTSTFYAAAVVGVNVGGGSNEKLYINGVGKNHTDREARTDKDDGSSWRTFGNVHAPESNLNNAVHAGKKIICAAFYDVALTAEQHAEVASMMLEI